MATMKMMKIGRPKARIPTQVYLLRSKDGGGFVCPLDDSGAESESLAYFSLRDAEIGAAHQKELWDVDCEPVRVK
ncbi:MAG TPA: hypothetical protein VFH53_00955 [Phycisphaerae bacterium]|nr:hypothetical protein [Phycisphaerae bacterium]